MQYGITKKYSANNHNSTQILVKGYKEIFRNTTDNPKIIVEQEGNKARLIINAYTANLTTSWVQYGSTAFMSSVKPKMPVVVLNADGTALLQVDDYGKLNWKSNTGSAINNKNIYAQIDWSIA